MAHTGLAAFGEYRQTLQVCARVVHNVTVSLQDRKRERRVGRGGSGVERRPGSRMSRVLTVIRRVGVGVGVWLMGLAGAAHACLICIPYPVKTAADFLIDSATVILAREHPDKPFLYAPVDLLKGNPDRVEIDLLLDSATRRLL